MSEPLKKKLGEILLEHGAIDTYQLSAALAHQRQWGGTIGRVLVELKFAGEEAICDALALQQGLASVRLEPGSIDLTLLGTLPQELLQKNYVIPLGIVGEGAHERLRVAMSDPTNMAVLDELRFLSGRSVEVVCAPESQIEAALRMEFSGEIQLPDEAGPSEAHFAGREIDLDPGDGGNIASFFGSSESPVAAVDVLGDGFIPELSLEVPALMLAPVTTSVGDGLTPGPPVLGTLLEDPPWAARTPPRAAPALDWEAPPIPPVTRTPAPRPPPAPPAPVPPVAVAPAPPAVIVPPPPPAPVPPVAPPPVAVAPPPRVPPPPPRAPPVAPVAPPPAPVMPKAAGPGPEEMAAEAERRAEEAARLVAEPSRAQIEAEALFRRAVEEQKLAEVGEAAVEKVEALDRPRTPSEEAALRTLEDMALGRPVERPIPPAQMVAALVRLLIRSGVIRDIDLIEELSRK